MDKKLPKVFANKIDKELRNNEKVYYEKNEVNIEPLKEEKTDEFTLNQKINRIFGSSRYVYKASVVITLNNGSKVNKKIIGRNKYELITMDNELIKISDIKDIKFDTE